MDQSTSQLDSDVDVFGLVLSDSSEEDQPAVKKEILRNPKKLPKTQVYSQRLGRHVAAGSCINCGEFGHLAKNPVCKLFQSPETGKKTWHKSGQTTPQQRATRFVDFLLSKFDLKTLQATGVLDIAGGMGKLALEFQLRRGIPCVIVDPRRELCPSQKQKKFLKFQEEHSDEYPQVTQLPRQKQILFEDDFLDDSANALDFATATLIVGLHPDEATERIVRMALQHKKNFAVVPCCVFARQFPHRLKGDGTPVKYYEEFCDYLQSLDPCIHRDFLPMPGRNLVLWARFD